MHELISQPKFKITNKAVRGDVFLTKSWNLLVHFCGLPSHHLCLREFGIHECDLMARAHIWWRDDKYHYQWASCDCIELDWQIVRDFQREIEHRLVLLPPDLVRAIKADQKTRSDFAIKRLGKKKHIRRYWR